MDSSDRTTPRRAEKKQHTRRRLIDAAAGVIAERGFYAASLMEIASQAGLTTGAIYSNFRSKEDLFLAVIRDTSAPLDLGPEMSAPWSRLSRAAILAMRGVDQPASRRLLKLQLEFALLTVQDPELLRTFADDIRADRDELAALLETGEPAPRPSFTPSPQHLATALIATLQGLQQHRFLDRTAVPEELAAWAMQSLIHAATRE